jgi:hypothetical protein
MVDQYLTVVSTGSGIHDSGESTSTRLSGMFREPH